MSYGRIESFAQHLGDTITAEAWKIGANSRIFDGWERSDNNNNNKRIMSIYCYFGIDLILQADVRYQAAPRINDKITIIIETPTIETNMTVKTMDKAHRIIHLFNDYLRAERDKIKIVLEETHWRDSVEVVDKTKPCKIKHEWKDVDGPEDLSTDRPSQEDRHE